MKPGRFDYLRPATLGEALAALAAGGGDAAVLAGGQSLMPMLNLRIARPAVLVDIKRVPGLDAIAIRDGKLSIGALARHCDVLASPLVRRHAPLLALALPRVAHAAIRNRGTFGGSLALADPAAELPACISCLGAELVVAGPAGGRRIAAEDFFKGIYETALATGEMLIGAELPLDIDGGWRFDFDEVARRHGDFAIVGLALGIRLDGARIGEARLAFCGVEAAPRRLPTIEARLAGMQSDDATAVAEAAAALGEVLEPLESEEYPPAYRMRLAGTLLRRALARLAGGADVR